MGRWKYSGRDVVEDTVSITVDDLRLWGYLKEGSHKSGILTLSRNGRKTGSLGFSVGIDRDEGSYISFNYLLDGEVVKYKHGIEHHPCNYGGFRYYFICCACWRRITALYFYDSYYLCRHCHKLVYRMSRDHRSQYEFLHHSQDLKDRAIKLRERKHPRKANKLEWEAFWLEDIAYYQLASQLKEAIEA